jgi:hypothetical protein
MIDPMTDWRWRWDPAYEELLRQRWRQRRTLLEIPERCVREGWPQHKLNPPKDVLSRELLERQLRDRADEARGEVGTASMLEAAHRWIAREIWTESLGHGPVGPLADPFRDAVSRLETETWPPKVEGLSPASRTNIEWLVALLAWADDVANDGYSDPRRPVTGLVTDSP